MGGEKKKRAEYIFLEKKKLILRLPHQLQNIQEQVDEIQIQIQRSVNSNLARFVRRRFISKLVSKLPQFLNVERRHSRKQDNSCNTNSELKQRAADEKIQQSGDDETPESAEQDRAPRIEISFCKISVQGHGKKNTSRGEEGKRDGRGRVVGNDGGQCDAVENRVKNEEGERDDEGDFSEKQNCRDDDDELGDQEQNEDRGMVVEPDVGVDVLKIEGNASREDKSKKHDSKHALEEDVHVEGKSIGRGDGDVVGNVDCDGAL